MPDRLDLVAAGHRPAAIVNTTNVEDVLNRVAATGLAAVTGDLGEGADGRLEAGGRETQIYVARSAAEAEDLRALDRAVRDSDRPDLPRENHALGAALGYPDCCAWAYPHTTFERPGEAEDVRWARNFLWRAGPGRVGPWSPWLNFHAARVFGLEFFEHFPCSPWCRPTIERNRALAGKLYNAGGTTRVQEALSQSVILWPDGRFLPFLCTGGEDGVLRVGEVGVPRGDIRPHFADRVLPGIHSGSGTFDGLRCGFKGWETRMGGGWRRLGEDPVVLAFVSAGQ